MSALIAEPLSQIRPESIRWLWEPYLPRGKVAVLDGDPGVGKSLLTTDLAARLSRGGALPDGTPAGRPHVTLLLNAEDDAADTTRPRAEAAGAALDRVIVVRAGGGDRLRFPDQLADLEDLVRTHAADLVVIDPVTAFLAPGVAAGNEQSVRAVLDQFAAAAGRTDCTLLLVRHLRKAGGRKALYRGLGSIGIGAAARTGLQAGRHPADPTLGVLAVQKANNTGPVPSLGYRVAADARGRAVVEWVGVVECGADALGAVPAAPLRPRDRAAEWLRAELAAGPRAAADVAAAAGAAGIPDITLKRAKAELGVESHRARRADGGAWYWYDPAAPWPTDAPLKKPFELPELDPL